MLEIFGRLQKTKKDVSKDKAPTGMYQRVLVGASEAAAAKRKARDIPVWER